jgi:hypothetical protein
MYTCSIEIFPIIPHPINRPGRRLIQTIPLYSKNLVYEKIKSRLNFSNSCYHSVQKLLFSRLLSKNIKIKIYKTIHLPAVLYGYEIWSLTLTEEHGLGVFGNRVLRRIFGPNRGEIIGGWRKLHNEEFHNLHSSPNIIIMIRSKKLK